MHYSLNSNLNNNFLIHYILKINKDRYFRKKECQLIELHSLSKGNISIGRGVKLLCS